MIWNLAIVVVATEKGQKDKYHMFCCYFWIVIGVTDVVDVGECEDLYSVCIHEYVKRQIFDVVLLPTYLCMKVVAFQFNAFFAFMSMLWGFFPRKYMLDSRALFSRSNVVFGFVYPTLWVCVGCVCVVAIDRNPFHIAQWKMEFLYGFTTVRHAHFHMQANRIDFSLFVFTIVTQSSSHSLTPIYRGHSGNSSIFVYIHMFYSLLQRNENKLFSSSMIFTRLALRQCIRLIDIELEILRLPFCCIFPCLFRIANWFSRL